MAATVTVAGSALTTTAGNKTVTATPAVGDLIVIITASTGVATTVADNGTGGTYTQVDSTRTGFSTTGNLQMWVRNNLVSAASSTVYTATQTSSTGGGLVVLRITGVTATGASAVRSSGGQSTGTAGTTPAPVLSSTPLSTNLIISAVANASNSSTTLVQRTGYTEDFDNGYNTPPTGLEVAHLLSGETSATLTQGGTSATAFASIGIELIVNQPPTVALNTPADTATGVSTTPDLAFTGTDADSDTIEYEVQVDTVNTFNGGAADFSLKTIDLFLNKLNTPTDGVAIDIRSSSFGGTSLGTSNTVAAASIPAFGSAAVVTFTFATPINLTATTKYYMVVQRTGARDTTNIYTPAAQTGTNPYANGGASILNSGTWNAESTTTDLYFVLYDTAGIAQISQTTHNNTQNVDGTGGSTEAAGQSFTVSNNAPLLDKLSATPDATFTDVTNGAHTHPFPSGEQVKYTVQAGDTLTGGTTYYWRVWGKDPSGTNTFGVWPTTQSFTTTSGSASASITQVAATVTTAGGTQAVSATVIASAAITQIAATITATGGTQLAQTNSSNAQVAATVTATGGAQSVATVNNVSITQVAATVTATGGTQAIATVNNVAITQTAANVTATGGTQTIATINNVALSQIAGVVTATGGTQTIATSNFVAISQSAATVTATGGTQALSGASTIAQVAANVTATGGSQTVASVQNQTVTQVAGTVTASGGTQTVDTVNNVSITQIAASVTAAGGTQVINTGSIVSASITQVAGTVTAAGGTQTVASSQFTTVTQTAATVTATGGTQTVATVNNGIVAQIAANVTTTGGTQTIATVNNSAVTQVAGNVIATGGTQSLTAMIDAAIAQLAATVTASGGLQDVLATSGSTSVDIAQLAASLTATGGVPVISTATGPLPTSTAKSLIFLTDGHMAVKLGGNIYQPL